MGGRMSAMNPNLGAENAEQWTQPTPSHPQVLGLAVLVPGSLTAQPPAPPPSLGAAGRGSTQTTPSPTPGPPWALLCRGRGLSHGGGRLQGDLSSGAPPGGEKEDKGAAAGFCTGSSNYTF